MTRAVFLDRDGVINRKPAEGKYLTCWEEFQILPGAIEGITRLNRAGFFVVVVTNQRCVAKGLLTTTELEVLNQRMSNFLTRAGATINAVYYCPHETEPSCHCRKPAPGMLLDAAREHGIDLPTSWMIGDSKDDIETGKNAGCKTARLSAGHESPFESELEELLSGRADIVAPSLLDAVTQILQRENVVAVASGV
jgi:D-glycero-D-manno-heptose 1,7-bisphosphate phosphatase